MQWIQFDLSVSVTVSDCLRDPAGNS